MNLKTWAANNGLSWQGISDQLASIHRQEGFSGFPNGRLTRLRSGKAVAKSQEMKALSILTNKQAVTFRDEVGTDGN